MNNVVFFITLLPNRQLKTEIYRMAPSTHNCQQIEIIGSKIYAGCISTVENNLQICMVDFLSNSVSECITYNFVYGLKEGESIENEEISMQYFRTDLGHDRFILNFKSSHIASLRNRFFIVSEKGNYSLTIPIEQMVLNRIKIMKCDETSGKMEMLMSVRNGSKFDLISFRLQGFILDRESLRDGLVREMVDWFDWGHNSLVIYETEEGERPALNVTLLNLEDFTQKKYSLPGKNVLVLKQFSQGFIFLRLKSAERGLKDFFINTFTNRFCMFDIRFSFLESWLSFVTLENVKYVFLFSHGSLNKFEYSIAEFPKFESVDIDFDADASVEEATQVDSLGQSYLDAQVTFRNRAKVVYIVNIRFVDAHYLTRAFHGTTLSSRLCEEVPFYLKLEKNNLPLDMSSTSVFYFNELRMNQEELLESLAGKIVATAFVSNKLHLVCLDLQVVSLNYRHGLNKLEESLDISVKQIEGVDPEVFNSPESVRASIISFKFVVVVVDEERLFYLDLERINTKDKSVRLKEITLPADHKCLLKDNILICHDARQEDSSLNAQLFLKFDVIEKELRFTEISTLIPDLGNLFTPFSFYYSRFNEGYFTMLGYNNDKDAIVTFSGPRSIISTYRVPFLDYEGPKQVVFHQLVKDVQLIVDFTSSIDVWVCQADQCLSCPTREFLVSFDEYVSTYFQTGYSLFAVLYRTTSGMLRALVYRPRTNANNRLVREFMLDADGCPNQDIIIRLHNPSNFIYMIYFCKKTARLRVFKYSTKLDANLVLQTGVDSYTVDTGESRPQIVRFEELAYENRLTSTTKKISLKEEDYKFEVFDLEQNGHLVIHGDVGSAELAVPKEGARLLGRVQLESVETLKHKVCLFKDYFLKFGRINDQETIVSDEFIISGENIQNNNFYRNCVKPVSLVLMDGFEFFEKAYLCQGRETLKVYFTDFLSMKLRIYVGERRLRKSNLLIVNDFLYLFNQSEGGKTISFYKYLLPKGRRGTMELTSTGYIMDPELTSAFRGIECLHLAYSAHSNSVFLFRKQYHSPILSISEMDLRDDHVYYLRTQKLELLSITGSPLFFRKCSSTDELEVVTCLALDLTSVYVVSLKWDGIWKVEIDYTVPLLYSIAYPWNVPISYIPDRYIAVVTNTSNLVRQSADRPVMVLHRLDRERKDSRIYHVMRPEEFDPDQLNFNTKIVDLMLSVDRETGKHRMVLATVSSLKSENKDSKFYNNLNIFKFSIDHLRLKYNLQNMNYMDSLSLSIFGPFGIKHVVELELLVLKNAKIFMYVAINVILFLVFLVLCAITFCIYRKRKRDRLARLDDSNMSDDSLDQSKSFAI